MSGSTSKNKGSSAERELAKFLSEVFESSFIRAHSSGAFIGGRNAFRKQFLSANQVAGRKGDITPPDHMPKLVIEAKFYADFRWHQLLQSCPCPQLETWIAQAQETIDEDDFSLIAFKINRMGWFVVIPAEYEDALLIENRALYHGSQGCFLITELEGFVRKNRHQIEALAA